jgi:hypothetical protein
MEPAYQEGSKKRVEAVVKLRASNDESAFRRFCDVCLISCPEKFLCDGLLCIAPKR